MSYVQQTPEEPEALKRFRKSYHPRAKEKKLYAEWNEEEQVFDIWDARNKYITSVPPLDKNP